jgi:hypothetical protein
LKFFCDSGRKKSNIWSRSTSFVTQVSFSDSLYSVAPLRLQVSRSSICVCRFAATYILGPIWSIHIFYLLDGDKSYGCIKYLKIWSKHWRFCLKIKQFMVKTLIITLLLEKVGSFFTAKLSKSTKLWS